jgi:hypothetical protein
LPHRLREKEDQPVDQPGAEADEEGAHRRVLARTIPMQCASTPSTGLLRAESGRCPSPACGASRASTTDWRIVVP